MSTHSLNALGLVAEEKVIDDYYHSLQTGEIDSRRGLNGDKKPDQELLEELKANLNKDLNRIVAQLDKTDKNNSSKSMTTSQQEQNQHIRFESSSEDEDQEKYVNDQQKEAKKTQQMASKKVENNEEAVKKNGRKADVTQKGKKFDYSQLKELKGTPRVNERIAFQVLELSSNFTPEVSDYKVATVVDFEPKTCEVTLKLHSEYNSILKQPSKFSIIFEDTEDDDGTEDRRPRLDKNKEEETLKLDWRNLMNIKLIPEDLDLSQLLGRREQDENDEVVDEQSEEQVIDDYYETVKKVDQYNKKRQQRGIAAVARVSNQHQQQQQQQNVAKNTKTEKSNTQNLDLDRIVSSVNAHAKAKWKKSAPPKTSSTANSKHIRFDSSSSTSSDSSVSSLSSSENSNSRLDEEEITKTTKKYASKNMQAEKDKQTPKKQDQLNKQKQQENTSKPAQNSPKIKTASTLIKPNSIVKQDDESVDTQTFMIQIGNVLELNSNSKVVTLKFNSNCKSEINLKITNNDNLESDMKKKRKKPERCVELDWKNSMNVKLIPNEINLNMKSQLENDERMSEDESVENEANSDNGLITAKKANQKSSGSPSKKDKDEENNQNSNVKQREKKPRAETISKPSQNKPTVPKNQASKQVAGKHIRFPSSSSESDRSSNSSLSSTESNDEREGQEQKKSKDISKKLRENTVVEKTKQSAQKAAKKSSITQNNHAKDESPNEKANNNQQKQWNKYYEPSKKEQMSATSYNRSFLIQNPQDLNTFKKVFNQAKLNAPNPEEFIPKNNNTNKEYSVPIDDADQQEQQPKFDLEQNAMLSLPPKIDYTQFEPLYGAPKVNQKIAFQLLEISLDFTPQVSSFKVATVLDFDENSGELTLKLDSDPSEISSVLKKPDIVGGEKDKESSIRNDETEESRDNQNKIKVDWRNLMNIRLIPNEADK